MPLGQVHTGLAADSRVHLRQQRGGDLEQRDAAHEDGGQESGHIGDDAAAVGDHHAGAVAAEFDHFVGQHFEGRQALLLFAARQEEDLVGDVRQSRSAKRPPWCCQTSSVETTKTLPGLGGRYCAAEATMPRSTITE